LPDYGLLAAGAEDAGFGEQIFDRAGRGLKSAESCRSGNQGLNAKGLNAR